MVLYIKTTQRNATQRKQTTVLNCWGIVYLGEVL